MSAWHPSLAPPHPCLVKLQDTAGNPKDVFLYNKAHLKANVQLPEPEDIAVPQADGKLSYMPFCYQPIRSCPACTMSCPGLTCPCPCIS